MSLLCAGNVQRFQNQAKTCLCLLMCDPRFCLCKIVIKNQYQAQVQANCDEMELIHVSFASPLCICVHMVFCMRKPSNQLISRMILSPTSTYLHIDPHGVLHTLSLLLLLLLLLWRLTPADRQTSSDKPTKRHNVIASPP